MTDLHDPPSHFTVDSSLAKELLKLSFKDRLALEEEIHGVHCGATEETSQLLVESLRDFDDKINDRKERAEARPEEDHQNARKLLRNIVRTSAVSTNTNASTETMPEGSDSNDTTTTSKTAQLKCYLNDNIIRLRFLRSECFDVDKAVQRLVEFLDFGTELFGDYISERQIRLSDFNTRQEEAALRRSRQQYLPFRDRSGRRVMVNVGYCNFNIPAVTRFKILIFLHWVASEDVETQRKGIVIVVWPFDESERDNRREKNHTWENTIRPGMRDSANYFMKKHNIAMPVRTASIQYLCKDRPFFKTLSTLYFYYALTPQRQKLFKAHFGEHIELLYKLSTYGIPIDLIPISSTGVVKVGHMTSWLKFLQTREDGLKHGGEDSEEIVYCPLSYDVIIRKGSCFQHNLGNTFYRGLIEKYCLEHAKVDNIKKHAITLLVVTEIEKRKGRFLNWSRKLKTWIVLKDRNRVRLKIAAALKQYGRTRIVQTESSSSRMLNNEHDQLKSAIDDSVNIMDISGHKRVTKNIVQYKQHDNQPSLKEYHFMEGVEKRQKMAIGPECGSIFGKCFHPTEKES